MVLSQRARRMVKWVGYPLFALLSFLICLYVVFPYDRLNDWLCESFAASGAGTMSIGSIGPSPLAGVALEDVQITLAPPTPRLQLPPSLGGKASAPPMPEKRAKPTRIRIDRAKVKVGLLALITGELKLELDATVFGGGLSGTVTLGDHGSFETDLDLEGVKLAQLGRLPQVKEAFSLPLQGELATTIKLNVPRGRWGRSSGEVRLKCSELSVGKGKIKVPSDPFLKHGVTLPRVRLGTLEGTFNIDRGQVTLGGFQSSSPDLKLFAEGSIRLVDPLPFSSLAIYLRFKIDEQLKQRETTLDLLEKGFLKGKRADGFLGLMLRGSFRRMSPPLPTPIAPPPPAAARRGAP
ncbi:MAG: type II secretion system protein GspN [Deltaproteobacteria bacterium]|nr:type II secretion system protein GspN [Deltaproteobacteria bacterium]